MATANFNLDAEDGWTAVTAAGVDFIRIRSNTNNHAFFVTSAASPPANTTTDAVRATGRITFSGQPSNADTITIGTNTFNFLSVVVDPLTDVLIGANAQATLDNLLTLITSQIATVTGVKSGTTIINLTAVTTGTAGNSIVLTESATNVVVNGAGTLTGGAAAVPAVIGYKVTCEEFWCDVTTSELYYVRNAENVPQNTRIDVFFIS